jgi:sporulation protein YlmC with PRC-barrel domain
MPTPSGHTNAIRASRVIGTTVYSPSGDKIGEVEDIVLEKTSPEISFAVVGFGGLLGIGEKYHPLPWSMLDYDDERDGYVVAVSKDQLEKAPADSIKELTKDDGSKAREACYSYYNVPLRS